MIEDEPKSVTCHISVTSHTAWQWHTFYTDGLFIYPIFDKWCDG